MSRCMACVGLVPGPGVVCMHCRTSACTALVRTYTQTMHMYIRRGLCTTVLSLVQQLQDVQVWLGTPHLQLALVEFHLSSMCSCGDVLCSAQLGGCSQICSLELQTVQRSLHTTLQVGSSTLSRQNLASWSPDSSGWAQLAAWPGWGRPPMNSSRQIEQVAVPSLSHSSLLQILQCCRGRSRNEFRCCWT